MVDTLARQTSDSPVQIENSKQLRESAEFAKAVDYVKRDDIPGGVAMLRDGSSTTVQRITEIATAMRARKTAFSRHRLSQPTAARLSQRLSQQPVQAWCSFWLALHFFSSGDRRARVTRPSSSYATTISILKQPSKHEPPIFARRMKRYSASPTS